MLHPRDEGYNAYQERPICPHGVGTREWYVWYMQGQVEMPYDVGTVEYYQWNEGWVEAHVDEVLS